MTRNSSESKHIRIGGTQQSLVNVFFTQGDSQLQGYNALPILKNFYTMYHGLHMIPRKIIQKSMANPVLEILLGSNIISAFLTSIIYNFLKAILKLLFVWSVSCEKLSETLHTHKSCGIDQSF